MSKRKREDVCIINKRFCIHHKSNKRKFEGIIEKNKRFFSNKDHYIKKLESCILEMDKKIKELNYLLLLERQNSHNLNIHM